MRRSIITTVAMLAMLIGQAQEISVQKYEVEASGGLSMPIGGYHGGDAKAGAAIGISLRHNFEDSPWDCGATVQLDCANRDFRKDGSSNYQNNRTTTIGIMGGYNFRQGHKVNPFASMTVGVAMNDVVSDRHYPSKGTSMAIIPKVGVELWHHVRANAYCQISRKGYNSFGLSLGLIIGGRPKK